MKKYVALLLLAFTTCFHANKVAAQCEPTIGSDSVQYVADDIVNVSQRSGNTLYLGGKFGMIGRYTGHFGAVDTATGLGYNVSGLPKVNGHIYKMCADGNGGWFIAGEFTKVGNQTRNYLAQIDANGVLTSFNANIVGSGVQALCVSGNTLFIGGWFSTVMGQSRNKTAAFDITTGNLKPWNPTANSDVTALTVYGNKIYMGGFFTTAGGQTRHFIACVDTVTGIATAWNPNMSQYVNVLAAQGGKIYAGGNFSTVGGQTRNKLAAIDTLTGLPTSWNPNPNDDVRAIIANDTAIFVAGSFSYIDTAMRIAVARFNTSDGSLTSFSIPFFWYNVGYDLALSGNTLFIGGNFSINSVSFTHFSVAKINLSTLAVDNMNSWGSFQSRAIGLQNNVLYAGGTFRSLLNSVRSHVAAIDMSTDTITNFKPNTPYFVTAMTTAPGKVFTAGTGMMNLYDSVTSNAINTFNPTIALSSAIYSMLWYNNSLYFCGDFSQVNTTTRRNLAAVNINGVVSSWNPNPYYNRGIKKLLLYNGLIYAGGLFDTLGGQPRNNLAALSPANGLATAWHPQTNDSVLSMDVCGTDLIIGGRFYTVNSQTRNFLAKVSTVTDSLSSWNPSPSGFVRAIKVQDGIAYIGGTFTAVNGVPKNGTASIDTGSNTPSAWNPLFETFVPSVIPPSVNDFSVYNNKLYVLGSFDSVDNQCAEQAIAIYNIHTAPIDVNITGNIALCAGDTLNLMASSTVPGASFQWYINGVSSVNSAALSYPPANNDLIAAIATAPSGTCYIPATAFESVTAQVNPLLIPTITINTNLSQAYSGTTINATAQLQNVNTSYSIQWFLNGMYITTTNNTNAFSFTKNGTDDTITAIVHTVGGCYNPDSANANPKIIQTLLVGVTEVTNEYGIKMYPSPIRDVLHLENLPQGCMLTIYNLQGSKVMSSVNVNSNWDMSLQGLVSGIYFLTVTHDKGQIILSKKIEKVE